MLEELVEHVSAWQEGGRLVPVVSAEAVKESEPRVFLEEEHDYQLCLRCAVMPWLGGGFVQKSTGFSIFWVPLKKKRAAAKNQPRAHKMEGADDAMRGHMSAHSFATGPVMAEPFISPLGFTITPALSSK